jgi:hypothetical protein
MKKYLFIILALLLTMGVANVYAAGIPLGVDPASGPEIWTQLVYNDSGSALTSGSVVVWDYTDSDMYDLDNLKMYITTTTTADNIAVAGIVVSPSIAAGDVGAICIYGPVKAMDVAGTTDTAGLVVGTSTTAGKLGNFAGAGNDDAALGWVIDENTLADSPEGGTDTIVVFVNPSIQAD